MPKDARLAVPRLRWIGAAGLVAVVVLAGLAWFLIKDSGKAAQSAATAPPPSPAVGVRPVVTKGVSQSFEFVGRIKAIDKVELRARVEGFLEKVLFREGQDVKTGDLLYQIEKVQFQAQVDQAKANLAVGRGRGRPTPSCNTTAGSNWRSASSARRARSTRTRRRSTSASGQGPADAGGAEAGRRSISTTPTSARRSTAASAAPPTPSAISSIRRAACWRPSSARIRSTCCSRSACATSRPSARRGARRAAAWPRSISACACSNGQEYPASRRLEPHRSAGRPADRHADHAGHHPQSRADRWSTASSSPP